MSLPKKRIRATSKPKSALHQAMAWLQGREYFPEELRARLIAAEWPLAEVEAAMELLIEKKLVSEKRALDSVLHARTGKRAVGRAKLQCELERRGAPSVELPSDEQEIANAVELVNAKYPNGAEVPKMARFLASRGFEEETISSVIDRLGLA